MSQAGQIFLKSTIALALTVVFCPMAVGQEQSGKDDERSVSLVKKTSAKSARSDLAKHLADPAPEQDIAVVFAAYPGVYATTLLPNSRFSQISLGGSMPFGGSGVASGVAFGGSGVAIIEDGINHAPLAYLDNSLNNLSMASVESIEVLHSPQAAFGPNGLGGAISITRDQIPSSASGGALELAYGDHNQSLINLGFGGQQEHWGSLFSFNRRQGDSYRVNRNQQSDDYSANDFIIRIKEIAPPLKRNWQQSELKIQFKDYQNNESRFGISRADLASNPMLRYMATAQNNERQEQLSIHLKHHVRLDYDELVTTDLYYNDGEAGYYQTVGVNGLFGDSAARELGLFEQMPLGRATIEKNGLARTYSSWGAGFKVEQQIARHKISLGVRYHIESLTDRLWSDFFSLDNQFRLSRSGTGAEIVSYKDTARVKSLFLTDQWQIGRWNLNVGVRHEQIKLRREDSNLAGDALGESIQRITLLSGAAQYRISDNWQFTLSGHQGYQPARSSTRPVRSQQSTIVRSGFSYDSANLIISAVAFTNVFDNLLGDCRGTAGCVDNEHNVGRARVNGVELGLQSQWLFGRYRLPIQLAYTHNDGEFRRDFDSAVLGGPINNGDLLPYVPRNQLYLKAGLAAARWLFNVQVSYRDVQRTTAGSGYDNPEQVLDDVVLLQLNASYQLASNQRLYLTVNNLTDEVYAESSFHAGVLAGRERTISVGYKMTF